MSYYVMECEGEYPAAYIETDVDLPGGPWMKGQKLTDFVKSSMPDPLVYRIESDSSSGNLKAMYKAETYPLMRDDFIEALREAGVDNLELFPAVIEDPNTGARHLNYKAFNIIGLVACADMEASELMGTSDSTLLDVDFHSLVIDESKTHGLYLFRLAEACNAIVVHEKVKKKIEEKGIPGMVFYGPGEWSG